MALFVPDRPRFLTLLVLILLSFALMIADRRSQILTPWTDRVAAVTLSIQQSGFAPGRWWEDWQTRRQEREALLARLAHLEQENFLLKSQMQRFFALNEENRRLHRLLSATPQLEQDYLLARVTARAADPTKPLFVIDRGSRDGVMPGHPVIDGKGLVGQVLRSTASGSEVLKLHAADHAVSVTIGDTGHVATLFGTGTPGTLVIHDVPDRVAVREGDMLTSSGLDGSFPAGYPVARVSAVRNEGGRAFLRLEAEPLAQLDTLREVLVLTPLRETREPDSLEETLTRPDTGRDDAPAGPEPNVEDGETAP